MYTIACDGAMRPSSCRTIRKLPTSHNLTIALRNSTPRFEVGCSGSSRQCKPGTSAPPRRRLRAAGYGPRVVFNAVPDRFFIDGVDAASCGDSLTPDRFYKRFIAIVTSSALPFAGNAAPLSQMEPDDLDAIAMLGLVVKENAIMIIDLLFDADRRQGDAVRVARHKAWLSLLRRVMMTSMAAILGTLPLMLGAGIGSELCRLLGLAIVRQTQRPFTTSYFYFNRLMAAPAGRRPARQRWGV